ncbi:MAG: ankyrin repeat domain-containing protein [Wolbachia sp.]
MKNNTKMADKIVFKAATVGKWGTVKHAVEKGEFDINSRDKNGCTFLIYAVLTGGLKVVEYLVEKGIEINAAANDGLTALHVAANPKTLKYLVENGANINATTNYDATPLCMASQSGHHEIAKYLEENGADKGAESSEWRDKYVLTSKVLSVKNLIVTRFS